MILLTNTTHKLQVITGAAVAACVIHASYVDYAAAGTTTPGSLNTTVSTATTSDVVAAPAASTYRNIKFVNVRNTNASTSNTITIQLTDGTVVVPIWQGVLQAGMSVQIDERGVVTVFSAGGIILGPQSSGSLYNASTASVSAGYASDTYLAGSGILIPTQRPRVGTRYRWTFDMTKTAAGTATPIITLRYGTNGGTTADGSLGTMTFSAGTAATDTGVFVVEAQYRSIGSGTSAVLAVTARLVSQPTTGLSSLIHAVSLVTSGHDSTTANTTIGLSFNGGTSFSGTNTQVQAEMANI